MDDKHMPHRHIYLVSNVGGVFEPFNSTSRFTNAIPKYQFNNNKKYEIALDAIGLHLGVEQSSHVLGVHCPDIVEKLNGSEYDRLLNVYTVPQNGPSTRDYYFHEFVTPIFCELEDTGLKAITIHLRHSLGQQLLMTPGPPTIVHLIMREYRRMAPEFVIWLNSNDASSDHDSGNDNTRFTIQLARTLELPGRWKCCLNSLMHPSTEPTVPTDQNFFFNVVRKNNKTRSKWNIGEHVVGAASVEMEEGWSYEQFMREFARKMNYIGQRSGVDCVLYNETIKISFEKTCIIESNNAGFRALGLPFMTERKMRTTPHGPPRYVSSRGATRYFKQPWFQNPKRGQAPPPPVGAMFTFKWTCEVNEVSVKVPTGPFPEPEVGRSVEELYMDRFNTQLEGTGMAFIRDTNTGRYAIKSESRQTAFIVASGDYMSMMGAQLPVYEPVYTAIFPPRKMRMMQQKPNFHLLKPQLLYVYLDIIEPTLIGENFARLLKVAKLDTNTDEYTMQEFKKAEYSMVENTRINQIQVRLVQQGGSPIPFSTPNLPSIVSLTFKKIVD